MKKWTGILLSLVVLFLLAYVITGFIVKNTLNQNVDSLPQNSILRIHLGNYQRGWFSSQAILSIKMNIPAQERTDVHGITKMQPPMNLELNYPLIIKHGPVICTDYGIRFGIGYVTTQPQSHYNVLINYFNETWFRYAFPALSFKGGSDADSVDFSWQGLSATLGTSSSLNNLFGDFTMYGLNAAAGNVTFQLGTIADEFNFIHASNGLWPGKNHFSLLSAAMSQGDQKQFELDGVDLVSSSDVTEGLLSFDFNLSVNKLLVDNKTYGPGIFKLSVRNLEADAMARINKRALSAVQSNQSSVLLVPELLSNVPLLLSKGSELALSTAVDLPEGKITGDFKLALPKMDVSDPSQLLQKASGSGQFKAPIAVVKELMMVLLKNSKQENTATQSSSASPDSTATRLPPISSVTNTATNSDAEMQKQVDKLLQSLIEKGYIKVEGNTYVVNLKIENQQIFVNGQQFDVNKL
ncbi:DUF945 family protein [Legionella fallonii]|uniref:Uncharacterized protein n=1 Tax=Legionella fallonii LLAP-10 TaxID=1212491 RepID=A0A098G0X6_9GAMM|nr:DUF945 family protein [Legionella fallonii]CEG55626.1 conserved exported protein of unknown function [Legionella fallonii LLAP-10]